MLAHNHIVVSHTAKQLVGDGCACVCAHVHVHDVQVMGSYMPLMPCQCFKALYVSNVCGISALGGGLPADVSMLMH